MEHSRLLKFFIPQRSIPDMAETPTFKVQVDYQEPENVEAEVPGSQEIREVDATVSEVTESDDFTLSPVITVTKKEATFTKGDLKLQKVTVTEDIAMEEIQNGGHTKVTRTYQSLQKDGKTITRATSTTESSHGHPEERKSKIPLLKFKQTVEKVQKEKKSRKKQDDEVVKRPRNSSIPKLSKETRTALRKETAPVLAAEDEFEKIYEQIADKQTDYKVLSVNIDDPEKVESKFEELIHAYEEDDNTSVLQVEKLRQTKIPALRRRKADGDSSKMSAIVNNIRLQNAMRNSREFPIEDEFGEVITKSITTKRYGRGKSQEGPTADGNDDSKDIKITKTKRVIKESSKIATPMITTVTRTEKVTNMDTDDDNQDVTMTVEANDDSNNNERITKTRRIVKQSSRIGKPVVTTITRTEKVTKTDTNNDKIQEAIMSLGADSKYDKDSTKTNRTVKQSSRITTPVVTTVTCTEKVTNMDTDDDNQDVTMTVEAYDDSNNERITKTRRIVKQSSKIGTPVVTTVTHTEKVTKTDINDGNIQDTTITEDVCDDPNNNNEQVTKTKRIIKQTSKIATPVITTVTRIENVTKMDDECNSDIDSVTTRKIITKRSTIPEVSKVTGTENAIVDITETNNTDIQDTTRQIARERIIKEISKVNPVITKVVNTNASDDGTNAKKECRATESIIDKNVSLGVLRTHVKVVENQDFDDSQDSDKKESSTVQIIAKNADGNFDDIITKTQTVTKSTIGPVSSKDKLFKVVTTQTSLKDTSEDTLNSDTTEELNTENMNTDTNITQDGTTRGVIATEQIIREGIKIGIPVFTKVTDETSTAIDVNIIDDKGKARTEKEKDSIKITHVTRTYSQENVQNVGMNKVLDWKAIHNNTTNITRNDVKHNKFDSRPTEQESVKKLDIINTGVTQTVNEANTKLTEDKLTEVKTENTEEQINTTNKVDTKIDVTKEIKDTNSLFQDKNRDIEETTVLKGNVSRLIHRLGSREHREMNKGAISSDRAEIDILNHERIKRIDKMISEFNKVDFKSIDAKEYAKESLNKKEREDRDVYTQDKDGEDILRGNVIRLINKLGAIETETIINRDVIINASNKNEENTQKFDEKSNQNVTELGTDIKHIDTDTGITVIKKETVDTSYLTHDKDRTNALETKIKIINNTDSKKETEDIRPAQLEKATAMKLVNTVIEKEIEGTGFSAAEKDSKTDDLIKGSVSRLITKITKETDTAAVTKDFENELPKKKSVLSKVAIFERLEPKEYYPKPRQPRSESKISKLVVNDISINEKPRIVDEVLKDHAKFNPNDINNKDINGKITIHETVSTEPVIVNEIWKTSFNKDRKVLNVSVTHGQETLNLTTNNNKDEITKTEDTNDEPTYVESNTENIRSNKHFITDKDNVRNETTVTESNQIYERVKQKYDIYEQNAISISQELNRSVSREYTIDNGVATAEVNGEFKFDYPVIEASKEMNEENDVKTNEYKSYKLKSKEDYRRAKSLAETDLGDAVKGKVNRMVGRLKSVDFDRASEGTIKTGKINVKEMPWKSSVLEKIALFEGKATAKLETDRLPRVTKKAVHLISEDIRRDRTTDQVKVTTAKVEMTTEIPPKIAANLVITEEMYQEKINELEAAKSLYQPVEVSTITLGNGVKMPVIALGTALLDPRLIHHIIGAAIDLGYRAIDTAYIYGNEKAIGDAIKAKIYDGTVKREELFIMSKLWSTFHRGDLVEVACRATLANLGLTYIDLFMIHNPMSFKEGGDPIPRIATVLQYSEYDYLDAWFAMEKLTSQGLVKSIGVSNFNSSQIQRILDKGRVKPVVNQVECHPYLSQERLHEFCEDRNITLSCFAVLGSKGTPAVYKSSLAPVIDDPLVQVMAQGLNITTAQLLIRFQIQSGHQAVVKSSSASHLRDNLSALNFTLSEPQMKALNALNRNKRMFTFLGMGETHKNYPFTAPY